MRAKRVGDGYVEGGVCGVDVVAVGAGMVAAQRACHVKRGRLHSQRIEDLTLHGFVVSGAKFAIGIDKMGSYISGGRRHQIAVLEDLTNLLEDLTKLAGGLHCPEQRERRFRRRILKLEDPFQILSWQSAARTDKVLD